MGTNATNHFEDGGGARSVAGERDVVFRIGVRSGSGWATVGSGSDADLVPGSGVGFDNRSDVGRRFSKTFSLKLEAVNWIGVRGGDGTPAPS